MWAYAGPVTNWSNAFLQPPHPQVMELTIAAATHQAVADRVADLFDDPLAMVRVTASRESVRAFVEQALVGDRVLALLGPGKS